MNAVIHAPLLAPVPAEAPATDTAWEQLPEYKRDRALARRAFIRPALDLVAAGESAKTAAQGLHALVVAGRASEHVQALARQLGGKAGTPSKGSIERWLNAYRNDGLWGLVDNYKGRPPTTLGVESRVLYYLRQGHNNNPGNITRFLQQEGHQVEYHQVYAIVKRLPASETHCPSRIGQLQYESRVRGFVRRSLDGFKPGECYQSDGNKLPIHIAHPVTGKPWRPEMTPCIDVVSRYVVGYYIAEAESAIGTMHALADAIQRANHVPLDFQADNGPGFKAKLVHRFLDEMGIGVHHGRARNPKDNGYIERFHGILKEELLKRLPGYSGRDANPDTVKGFLKACREARRKNEPGPLLTLGQFLEQLEEWLRWYNQEREHGELGCSPAVVWARLEARPPIDLEQALFWDEEERTVSACTIRFANREYEHGSLIDWTGKKVLVRFNLRSDQYVKVLTLDGRWICNAPLTKESPYRFGSVMEDRKQAALAQRLKTIDRNREEMAARAGLAITHDQQLASIARLTGAPATEALPEVPATPAGGLDLMAEILNRPDPNPKKKGASLRLTPFDLDE